MRNRFTFRSAKGREITINSPFDESDARSAAMHELWGPPSGWCHNVGLGLHLLSIEPVEDTANAPR